METDDSGEVVLLEGGHPWDRCLLVADAAAGLPTPPASRPETNSPKAAHQGPRNMLFGINETPIRPNGSRASEARLSVAKFVNHRFIPEHVAVKRPAGRAFFFAILKHVLSPDEAGWVAAQDRNLTKTRLAANPSWPYIGGLLLSEVDLESVQRLIWAALEHGYSIQTATHIRNVIRSIFAHATRTGCYTGRNPAAFVTLPAMSRREEHTLDLSQVTYLLHAMGHPERELALFLMLAELNVAEICGLQWKHLNLTNTSRKLEHEVIPPLSIAIRKQIYRGELSLAIGSRRRFVRATQPLCSLLNELKNRDRFANLHDFVLVSRNGTPIHPENIAARRLKSVGQSFNMAWLSWSVFHRTGVKLRSELGRGFDDTFERLLAVLMSATS